VKYIKFTTKGRGVETERQDKNKVIKRIITPSASTLSGYQLFYTSNILRHTHIVQNQLKNPESLESHTYITF